MEPEKEETKPRKPRKKAQVNESALVAELRAQIEALKKINEIVEEPKKVEEKRKTELKAWNLYSKAELNALELDSLPLETLPDYQRYNAAAKAQKKPLKKAPVALHPSRRVKFLRHDQPTNVLKGVFVDELIDFEFQLIPSQVYDLPEVVINHLNSRAEPIYRNERNQEGRYEPVQVGERARFSMVQAS